MHASTRRGEETTIVDVIVPQKPQPLMRPDDTVGAPFWRPPVEEQVLELELDDTVTVQALAALQPVPDPWPWLHSWHTVWVSVSACSFVVGMIGGILLFA